MQQDALQLAQVEVYPAEAKAALPDQAHTSFALLRVEKLLAPLRNPVNSVTASTFHTETSASNAEAP